MTVLEPGFYWVKFTEKSKWEVAQFLDNGTLLAWFFAEEDNGPFFETDFHEVGPRIMPPGSPSTGKAEPPPTFEAAPPNVTQLAPRKE